MDVLIFLGPMIAAGLIVITLLVANRSERRDTHKSAPTAPPQVRDGGQPNEYGELE